MRVFLYAINNALLRKLVDRVGSPVPGKRADFVMIDSNLITCPVDNVRETRVLTTYLDGDRAWPRSEQ